MVAARSGVWAGPDLCTRPDLRDEYDNSHGR